MIEDGVTRSGYVFTLYNTLLSSRAEKYDLCLRTRGWERNVKICRVLLFTSRMNKDGKCGRGLQLHTHRFRVCEVKRLADLSTNTRPSNP